MNPITALKNHEIDHNNILEWIEAALTVDWSAEYDKTLKDGEPTDDSAELGDVMEAIYWHCADYHQGQWSQEYALLCAVGTVYKPGICVDGTEPETCAHDYYLTLAEANNG